MKLGLKIILNVIDIVKESNFDDHKKDMIKDLILPFVKKTEDLDLMTIAKLEVLLDEELMYIPTKQQWRKLKLERLNEIFKNEK